jgi:hypothetical protein
MLGWIQRDALSLSEWFHWELLLRLLVPGVAVGVIIDSRCVADGVEVTRCVISATRELFSEDEGV